MLPPRSISWTFARCWTSRPPALTPPQQAEARQRRADGATLKELAQSYNVGLATISRLMKTGAA